ncbi:MAG: SUF system Fe-S cluster assembly regulator [Bdellovibrionales bacterium]|nr:SUF system Fe-S cluster assembly regulator [Bdellovibrionales bacterium]
MIQLNKHTDYGIVILTHFARYNDAPLLSAKNISDATSLSLPMVSKILKQLLKGGLLKSYQGVKGGYQLSRNPDEISIGEIIEVLDGPLALTECTASTQGACKTEHSCSIKPHWAAINRVMRDALIKLPLSSMTSPIPLWSENDSKRNQIQEKTFYPLKIRIGEKNEHD